MCYLGQNLWMRELKGHQFVVVLCQYCGSSYQTESEPTHIALEASKCHQIGNMTKTPTGLPGIWGKTILSKSAHHHGPRSLSTCYVNRAGQLECRSHCNTTRSFLWLCTLCSQSRQILPYCYLSYFSYALHKVRHEVWKEIKIIKGFNGVLQRNIKKKLQHCKKIVQLRHLRQVTLEKLLKLQLPKLSLITVRKTANENNCETQEVSHSCIFILVFYLLRNRHLGESIIPHM